MISMGLVASERIYKPQRWSLLHADREISDSAFLLKFDSSAKKILVIQLFVRLYSLMLVLLVASTTRCGHILYSPSAIFLPIILR